MVSTVRSFVIASAIGAAVFAAGMLTAESPSPADQQAARTARVAATEEAWQTKQTGDAQLQTADLCRKAVRAKARFGSKADFDVYDVHELEGARIVNGTVDLMNEFGAMIPHRYSCYSDGSTFEVSLTQGS